MLRSGSTLQYQLAAALLEQAGPVRRLGFVEPGSRLEWKTNDSHEIAICKLHHWDEELALLLQSGQARAIYSFRDLPNVAASAMRQFQKTFRHIWDERWLQHAAEAGDRWLAEPNVCSAKYEIFHKAVLTETRRIARHLGIEISDEVAERIANEYSPSSQLQKTKKIEGCSIHNYCETTLLHPGHISEELPAEALKRLLPQEKELIEREFYEWRKARGYVSDVQTEEVPSTVKNELYVPHAGWLKHPDADEVAHFLRRGVYEPDLQAFVWLYIRAGMRVIDVGAHFGLYSLLASIRCGKTGEVVAIEPNPESHELLQRNVARLGNVRTLQTALSDSPRPSHLHVEGTGLASHGYLTDAAAGVETNTTTLDTLLNTLRWDSADFIKIDTEGHEFQVLEGAHLAIANGKTKVLGLEFSEANLLRSGRTTRQLADMLVASGFRLCSFNLDKLELEPYEGPWPIWYKNLFAVRNLNDVNTVLTTAAPRCKRVARDIVARSNAGVITQKSMDELDPLKQDSSLHFTLARWAREAEDRFNQEKRRADEATAWARKSEEQVADARKLATINEKWACTSDAHLAQANKNLEALQKWAKDAEHLLAIERTRAEEATAWAESAEKRAGDAKSLATANEEWARKSDLRLAEANERIASLTKDLQDHLQWALRCERELKIFRK